MENKEIENAGKTQKQKQREEKEFNKKVAAAAEKKERLDI